MDEFDEESDKAHNGEPNRRGHCDLLEFYKIKQNKTELVIDARFVIHFQFSLMFLLNMTKHGD